MTKPNFKKNKNKKKRKHQNKAGDPHLDREKAKYGEPIASREFILELLGNEKAPMQFNALAQRLGLTEDPKALDALTRRVRAMQRDGQLTENRKRALVPVDADSFIPGKISAHPDGFGFLIPDKDDGQGDVYLSGKQMRMVLHGDRAVVCLSGVDRRGRREGRIIEIVERGNSSIVGRFIEEQGSIVIAPDNKRIHLDLIIPDAERGDAVHGDIVVAEIVEQPTRHNPPVGKVVEVLGKHMQAGMEIDMSLRSHDIPFEWPQAVLDQANGFSTKVQEKDKMGRKDVTQLPLVTIDGADARDFDDAVYCEKTGNGWRLLVAIADVAHYALPGTALDQEAESRGTSVYFPGRVVPMLPEVLSNGLCSINPKVDRLCMLCEMTLDETGALKKSRFYNAVMLSHARLTYSQVNEILTDESSGLHKEFEAVVPHLRSLHELYGTLAANRSKRGVIEFASTETRILFDDNKKISEIIPVQRNDAHKLIEECMILANVAAAGFIEQHSVPALYRVHHGPKSDRLEDLRAFLSLRGLSLGGGDKPHALDYAALSKQIEGRPDHSVISTLMLRSMQQAVYQPKNDGHFGLALAQYAHFTSPIRRYPDLLVHRAIKHILKRDSIINYHYSPERMNALGESCSTTERRAEEASRDVVSWLKCEYMQEHIGAEFNGVITAVTSFGLFIDLVDIHVEGLLHVSNLSHDFYRFEQASQAMVGERTGKQYCLGEQIIVRVDSVNLEERKIDFAEQGVTNKSSNQGKPGKGGSGKGKSGKNKYAKDKSGKDWSGKGKRFKKSHKKDKQRDLAKDETVESASGSEQGAAVSSKANKKPSHSKPVARKASNEKRTAKKKIAKKSAAKHAAADQSSAEKSSAEKLSKKSDKQSGKQSQSKKAEPKKGISKKVASKKTVSKKTKAKKITSKKAAAKHTSAKKVNAKKSASKQTSSKKVGSKKTGSEKSVANKQGSNKATAKNKVSRKKVASKTSNKTSKKKTSAKKPVVKKSTANKKTPKKVTAKKTAAKKTAAKKTTAKKTAAKNAAKKSAVKKTRTKKTAAKKTAAKKTTAKKKVTNKKVANKRTASKKTASKKKMSKKKVSKKATSKKKKHG